MSPAIETTLELLESLLRRLGTISRQAGAGVQMVEAADVYVAADLLWSISADTAALTPIVEELLDRARFPR
jgi:hypothetical protein